MKLNIGFFLGSKFGKGKKYYQLTKQISKWLNEVNHNVVFGGTETGCMGEFVNSLNKKKIKITAIIPKKLHQDYNKLKFFHELIITKDISKRTEQFILKCDCFLALPGGIGTLFEIIEIINKRVLGETSKTIFLLDELNYWDNLKLLFNHMVNEGFLDKNLIVNNLEIIKFCELKERLINVQN